jgi:hypothetical protein
MAGTTSPIVVKLKPCSGSDGVNWALLCLNSDCTQAQYINTFATANVNNGNDQILCGINSQGSDYEIRNYTQSGCLTNFELFAS